MSQPPNHPARNTNAAAAPSSNLLVRILIKLIVLGAGAIACVAVVIALAVAIAWPSLPNLHAMTDYRPQLPLRVYTSDHVLIGEFGEEHRNLVPFAQIPQIMKNALLAAEDDRFYQHGGVDWTGVVRAALTNIMTMHKTEGASTITMQVARNFFLSSEKTYSRKFYELLLTFKIEDQLTKDQILELYMNQIYLGHRAYGFAAAARTYFGKSLDQLTPAEAAILAGIPKAPSRFNPISSLPDAQIRQHYVLGRMHALGELNDAQYQQALAQPIIVRNNDNDDTPGYAAHGEYPAELARQLVYSVFQQQTYTRGLDVYTTINSKDQAAAYTALRESLIGYTLQRPYGGPSGQVTLPDDIQNNPKAFNDLVSDVQDKFPDSGNIVSGVVLAASPTSVTVARSSSQIITISGKDLAHVARALGTRASEKERIQRGSVVYLYHHDDTWQITSFPSLQGALISLNPNDGAINAMIGGFDFNRGNFNRAVQAWRQPGSNIKPFIYASAVERGISPATEVSDEPFSLTAEQTGSKAWQPKNDANEYEPMITVRQALYKSKNMVSIRLLQAVTPQYAQQYLTRFGFQASRWPAVLPIALGAGTATPLQMASAYSVFANGGYRVQPYLISSITNRDGNVIMRAQPSVAGDVTTRVIDPGTAWLIDDILHGVARQGTGSRAYRELKRTDIAGKTGTTNDSNDVWFSGYTPDVETTVWMGFDRPESLGSTQFGAGLTLSTWINYMQTALKGVPVVTQRPMPSDLTQINGEYYFTAYPPGQSVAALDLTPSNDTLGNFLNQLGNGAAPAQGPAGANGGNNGGTGAPTGGIPPAVANPNAGQSGPVAVPLPIQQ